MLQTKQQLRNTIQNYLYSSSSSPQFLSFLQKNRQKITSYLSTFKLAQSRSDENLSQAQMLKLNVDRYVHAFKLSKQMNEPDMIYRRADYIFSLMGITLNTAAFLNTIEMLGDDMQAEKWRQEVMNGRAFGGYGQTQLGHGSNVQGLELEAHYLEDKGVFRFNSPTIKSAKYWPGVLGLVCTHSVVQAKTFVKGKSIGIQTFVFQARDQNLNQIKGVKAGDIGPKFGFHRVDNGYLTVNNVQVPRDCMLMRYIQVTPQGEVKGQQNKQAIKYAYGSMLYLRVALPFSFSYGHMIFPARNLYALYQKMGVHNQPQYKRQIITNLSVGYGMIIANLYSQKLFTQFSSQLKQKNFQKADKILTKCHIISATFKALSSWKALRICTELSTRNPFCTFRTTYLPYAYNNIVPAVTYEGDNSVLLQQTARFILMKDKGEDKARPEKGKVRDDDLKGVIEILQYVVGKEIGRLKKSFKEEVQAGVGFKTMWNEKYQRDIIQVSKLWGNLQLLQGFSNTFPTIPPGLQQFFQKIGKIFTKSILKDCERVFTYGFAIQPVQSWKQFKQQQYWAMSHFQRAISIGSQEQKLLGREGEWLRSKL